MKMPGVAALRCASLLCLTALSAPLAQAAEFNFGVIGQVIASPNDSAPLAQAIAASDADDLAFVVANGFKRIDEPCSDQLYESRRDMLSSAKNGLVLSLAGSDWSECKNASGHATAVERLSRVRDLFYTDEFSFGGSKIPLIRQSNAAKFRGYVENARWEIDGILFVALNLPSTNNHYRMEAGRNSEFEDRLIANRDWLQRTFAIAARKKLTAVTLICDGDPLQKAGTQRLFGPSVKRDGFAEIRQQLSTLASKFPGKVLVIHNRIDFRAPYSNAITWRGNVGELEIGAEWVKIGVKTGNPASFSATQGSAEAKTNGQ